MIRFRARALATTALVGIAFTVGTPVFAQETQSTVPDQNQATNPGAAPPAGPVEANPTPTVSAEGEAVRQPQDIIVTGTRIPQPNLTSAAPVATVSNQDIKLTGATRIEDVISQLPSAAAPQGKSLPNPTTGTAELDLRYMGAKRTLTLINGRRMTPGDPYQSSSGAGDVNLIPSALVKRVEVLTGGASSVYGADAVAGVVNFIMDTDFEGLRLDGQISGYQHNNDCPPIAFGKTVCDPLNDRINAGFVGYDYPKGSGWDGRNISGTAAFGAGFDDGRGHVVGYFGYQKQNAVLQGARDYSACTLNASVPSTTGSPGTTCGGSSFSAEGNFAITIPGVNGAPGKQTRYHRSADGSILPGSTRYNYAPLNHWIKPDERYTAGLFANYEVTPAVKPYLEFMFMDDKQVSQIAPSGNFGVTFTINCDNPFMTAATRAIVCEPGNLVSGFLGTFPQTPNSGGPATPRTFIDANGNPYNLAFFQVFRRNVEGGPRQTNYEHISYRGVAGVRGDLSNAFSYDAYYQYGRTGYQQVYENDISTARLNRALNVVLDPRADSPTFGQPVCRSVLDNTDPACQPFDYFRTPSQGALDYQGTVGVVTGHTSEQIADVNFTGQLGELGLATPWASDGFGINVGWEYRREEMQLRPDQEFITSDLPGQGSAVLPIDGNFHVNELFAEAQLPIVEHGFIDELSFGAGYRKSWYKTGATASSGPSRKYDTDTYKLEAQFAPIADIRFRGSYNRASRAPNVLELFTTQHVGLDGTLDPCAGKVITATDYGCIYQFQHAQGGGIANPIGFETAENPSTQYNALLGGNPDLKPEKATTKTAGVVLQPRFLPRFALSVDYWNVKLTGAIQGYGGDAIITDCVDNSTATSIRPSCDLISRDPGGSLWLVPGGIPGNGFIYNVPINVATIKTDGYDINAAYSHRLGGVGNLSLSFLGTYLRRYITNNGLSEPYDCAGFYGTNCSGTTSSSTSAMPRWRHKARATLQTPFGLGVSLSWRMVGAVRYETSSNDAVLSGGAVNVNQRIKAQHYIDLAATYTLFDMVNLRAGVNNIFDKNPPIIPTALGTCPNRACAGNTYPGTWDFMGRYLYAGATIDFKHKAAVIAPPQVIAPPPPPPAAPATITCPDGLVILANQSCPALPPPPPPPAPAPERGL